MWDACYEEGCISSQRSIKRLGCDQWPLMVAQDVSKHIGRFNVAVCTNEFMCM